MFFKLHNEQRIGYKHLTDPDLGRKSTSNVTHIGLFDDVLTFLPNDYECDDCILIHNDTVDVLPLFFNRIARESGKYDSPKIRLGPQYENSVARAIRDEARTREKTLNWYLLWFGLESEQPVFLLFNETSKTKSDLKALGIDLQPGDRDRIIPTHPSFLRLINYLENLVNTSRISYAEELEVTVQLEKEKSSTIRPYNFTKAYERSLEIGRGGENLIAQYLDYQKSIGAIADYCWMNRKDESGLPYDFSIKTLSNKDEYLEVKTTDYRFEQKMIFSHHEIAFAAEQRENYFVYRVYCDKDGKHLLRICTDNNGLFDKINARTNEYINDLAGTVGLQNIKLAISPNHESLISSEPIVLFGSV